jgi:hypothetical protein
MFQNKDNKTIIGYLKLPINLQIKSKKGIAQMLSYPLYFKIVRSETKPISSLCDIRTASFL